MNYHAKNDEGEVCFRGPGVFMGYFENEAKTKEVRRRKEMNTL